jgi:hypothetical protein
MGAWTFIRFKTAGQTWEGVYDCSDRGPLNDGEFIRAAVSQSIQASKASPFYRQSSGLRSNLIFAEKFILDNPGCCSIYHGDPNDYFSPEGFEEYMTRTVAKIVKIKFMKEDRSNGVYFGRTASYYVKLDACGNQLD